MSRIRRIIGMPDYDVSKVIDVKANLNTNKEWTAPSNGCVIPYANGSSSALISTTMYINGVNAAHIRSIVVSGNWSDHDNPGPIPVAKGDVIKFSDPSVLTSAEFYPCK